MIKRRLLMLFSLLYTVIERVILLLKPLEPFGIYLD
jgi:hypothetical protein